MSASDLTQAQDGLPTTSTPPVESPANPQGEWPPAPKPRARDRKLTISPRRLAGSPACLNCGTPLHGPFCYYCGQPDKNLLRFFPVLVRDLLEDLLDFDSRFMRTIRPLLLHPGRLTRDYLDGRRFRYVPPMRLYIFSSMIFFILAATVAGNAIGVGRNPDGTMPGIHIGFDSDEEAEKTEFEAAMDEALGDAVAEGDLTEEMASQIEETVHRRAGLGEQGSTPEESTGPEEAATSEPPAGTEDATEGSPKEAPEEEGIVLNGERWDRETNPVVIPVFPKFINDWINDEIEESPQKGREIEENPNLIVDKVFDVMPVAVFVMLPLVALLLKFWYLFAGKYYVEHLIHALHNHSFLFVVFILTSVSDGVASWLDPEEVGRPSQISSWITIILLCWIPLYLLLSLKTVYRQGWFMTFMKFSLLGVSYLTLLALVTSVAAVAGFVLL